MTPRPTPSLQPPNFDALKADWGNPPNAARLDIDAQIKAVEQRIVAREAWLIATTESLAHRAQTALTPKAWVIPVVGAGLVLWLGWRVWHRKKPLRQAAAAWQNDTLRYPCPHVGHAATAPQPVFQKMANLPWAGLAALGWPLAPAAWRERLSPAAAVTVVSTVLSFGRLLFQRGSRAVPDSEA